MVSPEALHVSKALREHGMAHIGGLAPLDEYDCCAEVAIDSYNEFLMLTKKKSNDTVVSELLNDTGELTYGRS